MDGKDFFSGFRKGQVGIVKLASVQFLVVGAVQRVIIAGFRCLDIQVIAAFQTVGGLLRGFFLFAAAGALTAAALYLHHREKELDEYERLLFSDDYDDFDDEDDTNAEDTTTYEKIPDAPNTEE